MSLFGPGSAAWELCRERAVVAMAPRAVLLQHAHPAFAAASAAYTPRAGSRFDRAASALSAVVFADEATALATARRVERLHAGLAGATDAEPLAWVLVTLLDATVRGAELVRGRLPDERVAAFLADGARFGRCFGVRAEDVPRDRQALDRRVDEAVRDTLVVGPEVRAVWDQVVAAGGVAGPLLARWVAATLPGPIALALGTRSRRRWQAAGRGAGRAASLLPARFRFRAAWRDADIS